MSSKEKPPDQPIRETEKPIITATFLTTKAKIFVSYHIIPSRPCNVCRTTTHKKIARAILFVTSPPDFTVSHLAWSVVSLAWTRLCLENVINSDKLLGRLSC